MIGAYRTWYFKIRDRTSTRTWHKFATIRDNTWQKKTPAVIAILVRVATYRFVTNSSISFRLSSLVSTSHGLNTEYSAYVASTRNLDRCETTPPSCAAIACGTGNESG